MQVRVLNPIVNSSLIPNRPPQDEELVRLFSDGAANPELADAVTAVRVVRDRATNIGKGVAYVEVSRIKMFSQRLFISKYLNIMSKE